MRSVRSLSVLRRSLHQARNTKARRIQQKQKMKEMSFKRIKAEMAEISADQKSIREGQMQVRDKFKEIESECAQLREETNLISQHAKGTQMRLDLLFEILQATVDKDIVKAHNLTNSLRELIASQDERESIQMTRASTQD